MLSCTKKITSVLLSVFVLSSCFILPVSASSNTFSVDVEFRQTDARSMLSMINEWRTGGDAWYWNSDDSAKVYTGSLSALTYDYNLEQIAMQRAVEYIFRKGHYKPDGRSFQIWASADGYNGTYTKSENLARGTVRTDAASAFEGWQETTSNYSGQGHRRTMLGNYSAIGIAHVYYNGNHYWAQEFGYSNSGAAATAAVDSSGVTRTIDYGNASLYYTIGATDRYYFRNRTLNLGYSEPLPNAFLMVSGDSGIDYYGVLIPKTEYTCSFTSSNTSVVKIQDNKTVAVGGGSADITCTIAYKGTTYTKSYTLTVPAPSFNDITISGTYAAYTGSPVIPEELVVTLGGTELVRGTDYEVSATNNINVGRANGLITGLGQYAGSSKSFTFNVSARHIYYAVAESPYISTQTYTGSPLTPSMNLSYNGKALTEGVDYTLSYEDNINYGTGSVTITGMGNFNGAATATFNIARRNISTLTIDPIADQTYTGSAITPSVVLRYGTITLTEGTDYTVEYSSNTAVGTALVKITGKGNYSGSKTVTFKINQALPVSEWVKEDGKWYYYDASSNKVTGWQKIGKAWYYFDGAGAMQTGWQQIESKWYYFDASGAMQKGWKKISGQWFYFDASGVMQTGWQKVSGKWYYLKSSGAMLTGWLNDGGKWYYLDSSGVMVASATRQIGNKSYTFNASGVCVNPNGN